jgi:hypothetical protein
MSWTTLLTVDSQAYRSYINTFQACRRLHTHPEDFYTNPEAESKISDEKSNKDPEEQPEEYLLADFEAFACRKPQKDFICIDLLDSLGSRDINHDYD